jgi:hypothetical protein
MPRWRRGGELHFGLGATPGGLAWLGIGGGGELGLDCMSFGDESWYLFTG